MSGGSSRRGRPVGTITRGTTAPGRLRRNDAWLARRLVAVLRSRSAPVVVDLGFGATPDTLLSLDRRLRAINPRLRTVGVEIDRERVERAREQLRPGIEVLHGGFEVGGLREVVLVRAFNVLRQYDEGDVADAWATMAQALAPDGRIIDGTCDEAGTRACWIDVRRAGPATLTIAADPARLARPSDVAERLPKALIHRNVAGERVHAYLAAADDAWEAVASQQVFGSRRRWSAAAARLRADGWPLLDGPAAWARGELTVRWSAVAPSG